MVDAKYLPTIIGGLLALFHLSFFRSLYWAPGLDGGYYVLQVQSLIQGEPLFGDSSIVFLLLRGFAWCTGDIVLGNELFVALCSGGTATFLLMAGRVLGADRMGVGCAGVYLISSTLFLGFSNEFVKNAFGLLVWSAQLWLLCSHRYVWAFLMLLLASFAHKLSAGLCVLSFFILFPKPQNILRVLPIFFIPFVGLFAFADLERIFLGFEWPHMRLNKLWNMELPKYALRELLLLHGLPLLSLVFLRKYRWRIFLLAFLFSAWGFPLQRDELSWRFLIMAFVPIALFFMLNRNRIFSLLCLMIMLPHALDGQRWLKSQQPNYGQWLEVIPRLQEHIQQDRVVAHRGVCGFVWAVGGITCENFEPQEIEGTWRIVYGIHSSALVKGMSNIQFAPIALLPGYALLREEDYQKIRKEKGFRIFFHPRNPYRSRPSYVYRKDDSK